MRIAIIAILIALLAVSASAMQLSGDVATLMGNSTDDPNRAVGNPGGEYVNVILEPSNVFKGFAASDSRRIYVQMNNQDQTDLASAQIQARITEKKIANLAVFDYLKSSALKPGDFLVIVPSKLIVGRGGTSNSQTFSEQASYGSSRERHPYNNSTSTNSASSSSTEVAEVYNPYKVVLKKVASDGALGSMGALDYKVGGSASAVIRQSSSESFRTSRDYNARKGSSHNANSVSSTSTTHHSAAIVEEQLKDEIESGALPNIGAIVIDTIATAAANNEVPGAVMETYQAPRPNNITPDPDEGQVIRAELH